MVNPDVTVRELSIAESNIEVRQLIEQAVSVDLGEPRIERLLSKILTAWRRSRVQVLMLHWKGGKIPRGAIINGHEVAWVQNGVVHSDSDIIGMYERLVEFGGTNKDEHVIIVFSPQKMSAQDIADDWKLRGL